MKKHYKRKDYILNILPCILYGVMGGAFTGSFVFFFKWLAKQVENASRFLYAEAKGSPLGITLAFCVLITLGLSMAFLHKWLPEVEGGGIPRSEGVLRGLFSFRSVRTLLGTFIGSMIGFFAGLPLGCEGPAVLMGTCIGGMCVHFSRSKTAWRGYVMSGGAGAGFAVATGAPLSGILFVLEEVHKRFTPMLVLTVSASVISATLTGELLAKSFGMSTALFHFPPLASFSLSDVLYLLVLGVLLSLAVFAFDSSISLITRISRVTARFLGDRAKLVSVFVLTGAIGFLQIDAIYSGHHTVEAILFEHKILAVTLLLLLVRFLMMLFVLDSGATGGSFVPTLALGALIGSLFAKLLIALGLNAALYDAVVLLSMCAFIGGTLRAPLTATVLFVELTGQFTSLFYVSLVVFTVYAITELLNHMPFYEAVLHRIEEEENAGKTYREGFFEMKVSSGAFVVGKTVRDVIWPSSAVVLSVKRAGAERKSVGNVGDKFLHIGDTVVVKVMYSSEAEMKETLYGLVGREREIKLIEE